MVKILSVNDKNHSSDMARPGAARKARIARKDMINKATPTWSTAPPADKAVAIKKPRGRPPKNKRSPHQSVNELCVEDGDGYAAEGTHTHLSLSRRPLIFCVLQLAPPPRRRPRRPSPHHRPVRTICRGAAIIIVCLQDWIWTVCSSHTSRTRRLLRSTPSSRTS